MCLLCTQNEIENVNMKLLKSYNKVENVNNKVQTVFKKNRKIHWPYIRSVYFTINVSNSYYVFQILLYNTSTPSSPV